MSLEGSAEVRPLENDPTVIVKYHPTIGKAHWSLETNAFLLDASGQPIKASEKVTRCAHCGAVKRVKS
jgi:hypothetical protein